MIELDRKLFQLCKPEGVKEDIQFGFLLRGFPWCPSCDWRVMEPEIRKACKKHRVGFFSSWTLLTCTYSAWFESVDGNVYFSDSESGRELLPESAARALISLLTAKAGKVSDEKGTENIL